MKKVNFYLFLIFLAHVMGNCLQAASSSSARAGMHLNPLGADQPNIIDPLSANEQNEQQKQAVEISALLERIYEQNTKADKEYALNSREFSLYCALNVNLRRRICADCFVSYNNIRLNDGQNILGSIHNLDFLHHPLIKRLNDIKHHTTQSLTREEFTQFWSCSDGIKEDLLKHYRLTCNGVDIFKDEYGYGNGISDEIAHILQNADPEVPYELSLEDFSALAKSYPFKISEQLITKYNLTYKGLRLLRHWDYQLKENPLIQKLFEHGIDKPYNLTDDDFSSFRFSLSKKRRQQVVTKYHVVAYGTKLSPDIVDDETLKSLSNARYELRRADDTKYFLKSIFVTAAVGALAVLIGKSRFELACSSVYKILTGTP